MLVMYSVVMASLKEELFKRKENIIQKIQGNHINYWLSEMEWPKKKDNLVLEYVRETPPLKTPEDALSLLLFLCSHLTTFHDSDEQNYLWDKSTVDTSIIASTKYLP